jgi:hypothetical protein
MRELDIVVSEEAIKVALTLLDPDMPRLNTLHSEAPNDQPRLT